MEDKYRPISMALNCPAIKFNSSPLAQRRSCVCVMAKPIRSLVVDRLPWVPTNLAMLSNSQPIPSLRVDRRRLLTTTIAMLSNSQGELADKLTRLRKELKRAMYLYKSACKEYQAMSATEKGELKDKLTKLIKELQQTMSAEDLYNSACKELQCNFDYQELQAMSAADLYNLACNSITEKRNYLAGTSKGKERIEGEREDDVTVQHEDMFEEEKRSILEPSGALALAGAEAYCKYYGLKGENVVATTSGANMNFDRLRLVTKLADIGRQREAVLATYMPEEPKGAGTSKGESLKGEGEDDVTVQHEGEHEDILTRLKKVLQQAMPAPETDMFEEEKRSILEPAGALALAGAEAYCKYYGLKGENVVATTSGATMNFDRLRLVTELADVGRQREAVLATYMPEEPKGAGTSKGERLKGEGEDDVTVQHERKYEAGTSKGRELIEGEGEDDVTAQYIADAIGSVFKERLKDDDLLFSLSLPPPDFALFQRAEEREHNFARERAEEREHNFALPQMTEEREHNFALSQRAEGKENKNWFGGLGSVVPLVINVGICAATYIGVCLLYKDAGKKVDVLALRLKAVNEAWDAAGCPPPTVCVLNPSVTISSLFALFNFGNPSTTVSTPVGLFNRGNPSTTVSPLLGLININIGK